ncbi:MAG: STAS domain-containing protein [Chloroflexi bacterium]|nr:STAS domain-containing protein [Chloroflexota bacterium]
MEITGEEIERRKAFLEFGDEDVERLMSMNELAQQYADSVIEAFYRHLLSFEEGRAFFPDPALLERVKRKQKAYFVRLTQGNYGPQYVEDRLRIGLLHERINLPTKLYLGMYNFYLRTVASYLLEAYPQDSKKAFGLFLSLLKLVFLDINLAIDTYIHKRERTLRLQQEAIREISTPVLQLRQGLLILPIIGVVDSLRALQLTEQLLRTIRSNRARVVVMDITGVPVVDSKVANHFIQTVEAARLMGATVILTGLSPAIARSLVSLGVDLSRIRTVGDLQGGIEEADHLLGYRVVKGEELDARARPA